MAIASSPVGKASFSFWPVQASMPGAQLPSFFRSTKSWSASWLPWSLKVKVLRSSVMKRAPFIRTKG